MVWINRLQGRVTLGEDRNECMALAAVIANVPVKFRYHRHKNMVNDRQCNATIMNGCMVEDGRQNKSGEQGVRITDQPSNADS